MSNVIPLPLFDISPFLLRRPESMIAPYLTALQARLKPHGIQVGSYPVLSKGVFVSLIGRDLNNSNRDNGTKKIWLADVAREVEKEVGGRVVSEEEVATHKKESVALAPERPEPLNGAGAYVGTMKLNLEHDSKSKAPGKP